MNRFHYNRDTNVLSGYYNDSVDINSLHSIVLTLLNEENIIGVGNVAIDGLKLVMNENTSLKEGIDFFQRLASEINNITKPGKLQKYEDDAQLWLNAINTEKDPFIKMQLIVGYIQLINKYVRINIQYTNNTSTDALCNRCNLLLDDNEEHCKCGNYVRLNISASKYIDTDDQDIKQKVSKDIYDKFKETYLRFQGRWNNLIADSDINIIREYLQSHYCIENTEDKRSENRALLRKVLTILKFKKYHKDLNLLMFLLWKYERPNLSHLDTLIERNWRWGQTIIDENMNENDASTIAHNDWRLYKELTYIDYDCDEEDFQISANKQVRRRYDELWKLRCIFVEEKLKKLS